MDLESLYLDYNATSPLSQSVKSWLVSGDELFANPASQHLAGKKSRKIINECKDFLFDLFKLDQINDRIFFHSGATEGIYSVTHSLVNFARSHQKKLLICFSPIDHAAVSKLNESFWADNVEFFKLNLHQDLSYNDELNLKALENFKSHHPDSLILYHHLWVHNETGLVSPLEKLKFFKEIPNLFIHVDAVQAPGKIMNWNILNYADAYTLSGHKFGSLKGIGLTILKKDFPTFSPLFLAGGQQQGMRGGTENVLGIKTLCLALEDLKKVNIEANFKLKNEFYVFLKNELCEVGEIISSNHQNSNTIYFYLNKISSDVALALFDLNGIMLSAGSACSSGASKPSIILTQLGKFAVVRNGLRISLGFDLTEEKIENIKKRFLSPLERIKKFQKV